MKLIAFSDIHGNSYALDAFLKQIEKEEYDSLIFCGDIFGYYYNQEEVIMQMNQLKNLIWIKGNHDIYFQKIFTEKESEAEYIKKYGHSYENVKSKYKKIFSIIAEKQEMFELNDENLSIGIFHGIPENPLEGRLYPNNEIINIESFDKYDIVILGHTHCRMKRFCGKTLIVNPGSLGQPRDGKGYSYAMIDTKTQEVEFKNVFFETIDLYKQIDCFDKDLKKLKEVLERV